MLRIWYSANFSAVIYQFRLIPIVYIIPRSLPMFIFSSTTHHSMSTQQHHGQPFPPSDQSITHPYSIQLFGSAHYRIGWDGSNPVFQRQEIPCSVLKRLLCRTWGVDAATPLLRTQACKIPTSTGLLWFGGSSL